VLYRLTGGNPFYVTEVVQSGMGEIPVSARDAVVARASRLSANARDMLDAAALIGGRVGFPLLESVTGCLAPAVDELLAAGLFAGDSAGLRFRHEIARLAVQDTVAGHRRRLIHARILDALCDLGHDDDARLAFHAEAAGDRPAVLRYAPAAAHRAAELGSHREAAAQFERALRFADGLGSAQAARLFEDLAGELAVLDRWQDAADARERALTLWRAASDRLREGDSMRHLARALGNLCRGAEAVSMAESALATLRPLGPSTELAWAYANLAGHRMVSGDNQAAIDLAVQAQAIAESLGIPEVLSSALNAEGCAAASLGRDWTRQLHRALDVAVSGGLQEMAGLSFTNICSSYGDRRQFAEAEQHYTVGVAYCDDHDITSYARCLRSDRIIVLERTGRWAESLALSTELLSRPSPSPINRLVPLNVIGVIRARRGEPGAWDYLDQAVSLADGIGEPQHIVPVRLARAEAFWLSAQMDAAVHEAELAGDVADRSSAWDRGAVAAWLQRTGAARAPLGRLTEPYQRQEEDGHGPVRAERPAHRCPHVPGLLRPPGIPRSTRLLRPPARPRRRVQPRPAPARQRPRRHPAWLPQDPHPLPRGHRLAAPRSPGEGYDLTFKLLGCLYMNRRYRLERVAPARAVWDRKARGSDLAMQAAEKATEPPRCQFMPNVPAAKPARRSRSCCRPAATKIKARPPPPTIRFRVRASTAVASSQAWSRRRPQRTRKPQLTRNMGGYSLWSPR
jgi:tetratricopeptide (TPR) repeat protein